MDDDHVTIIIRTQQFPDMTISLDWDSTVLELKAKLAATHPDTPIASSQKLIYDGKILNNERRIREIVNESNVVIQLAYPADQKNTNKDDVQSTVLRNRFQTSVPSSSVSAVSNNEYNGYSQAYSAWMQQYQQQYSNYMQYYSGLQNPYLNLSPTVQPGLNSPQNHMEQPPPAPQEQEVQADNVEAGIGVADDNNGQPDWLDAAFGLTRFFFLLSVIYFYSSTFRFVIALSVLIVVYLYQAGFFQVARRPVRPQENPNRPQDAPVIQDNNNNINNPDPNGEAESDGQDSTEANPPPSLLATCACFIRSFFSSLIPAGPPGAVN